MRYLNLIFMLVFCTCLAGAQKNIRQVDFRNFTYPLSGHLLGHSGLQWLNIPTHAGVKREPIHLVNGSDLTKTSSFVMNGKEYAQYEGFTLESVKFEDLTGDGKDEAVVVLRYQTGGTQTTHYVYIYAVDQEKPKLLAYCHTGDGAYYGLYNVYGKDGLLVFELLDPKRASGDCCSAGEIVSRYKWRDGRFEAFGSSERHSLNAFSVHR
ncbi:MAG TPA: hypothetical protein VMU57_06505 [Edaphobacter sp.]|uniref:hypothetical protein n=1 Tax=Edaphobacter sp. TaxID=1934404 RepID=UPI002C11D694|nr:hypothetical protein [Edaphobacter sp.]HUZ94548.1 hypothetical protein [Edaphobacter sp.]